MFVRRDEAYAVERSLGKVESCLRGFHQAADWGALEDFWHDYIKEWRDAFELIKARNKLLFDSRLLPNLEPQVKSSPILQYIRQARSASTYTVSRSVVPTLGNTILGTASYPRILQVSNGNNIQTAPSNAYNNQVAVESADGTFSYERLPDFEKGVVSKSHPESRVSREMFLRPEPFINKGVEYKPPVIVISRERHLECIMEYGHDWLLGHGKKLITKIRDLPV